MTTQHLVIVSGSGGGGGGGGARGPFTKEVHGFQLMTCSLPDAKGLKVT